jgi:hypothetical protein
MIFCTGCGKELHETAPTCPHCGKQVNVDAATHPNQVNAKAGSLWPAITSLVLSAWCVLGEISQSSTDNDTTTAGAILATAGLLLGILSLNISPRGKGMAIAGIVLAGIGLCLCLSQ